MLLTEPIDVFIIPSITEYQDKKIVSAEKADIDLKAEDKIEKPDVKLSKALLSLFKEKVLRDKVEDVVSSKRLVDSAVTLVSGKKGWMSRWRE